MRRPQEESWEKPALKLISKEHSSKQYQPIEGGKIMDNSLSL